MKTTFFIDSKWLLSLALLLWQGIALAQVPAISWQKCLGGSWGEQANSIQQTIDGGYIVAGLSSSKDGDVIGNHGDYDSWIVKLDVNGIFSWQKSLGGWGYDEAYSIQQTTDGGYIVGGTSTSNDGDVTENHGFNDYWLIKLDANGNLVWQKSLGGSGHDWALSIQQTTDGGYIVAGTSESVDGDVTGNHGSYDVWIVKLDSSGNLSWQKSLGGSSYDAAWTIQQTTDGGYIVVGMSDSKDGDVTGNQYYEDYWIVKLDSSGNLSWQDCIGGGGTDRAYSVEQTTDGGYIVAGWSNSVDGNVTGHIGGHDYWIVKLNANGTITWKKNFGGSGDDEAYSVKQTIDGGYIVAGRTNSIDGDVTGNHGGNDYWIVKLDANGNLSWQKCLGGSNYDWAYSIQQTTDGGYIVAGSSNSIDGDVTGNHGESDYWIVKLDANGDISWQESLGGSSTDAATSIQQTTDGGYIVAGYSQSNDGNVTGNHGYMDYWIVKLAATGNLSWQKCLGGSNQEMANSIQQTTNGNYIVAGYSQSNDGDVTGNHGYRDYWIVKLNVFGVEIEEGSSAGSPTIRNKEISVSPNPALGNSISLDYYLSAATEVEISIIDIVGKRVAYIEKEIEAEGAQSRVIEVGHLASGLYFLELRTKHGKETVRWVKE